MAALTKTENFLYIVLKDSQGYEQSLKLDNPITDKITRAQIENAISDAITANATTEFWVSSRGYKITGLNYAKRMTVTTVQEEIE